MGRVAECIITLLIGLRDFEISLDRIKPAINPRKNQNLT